MIPHPRDGAGPNPAEPSGAGPYAPGTQARVTDPAGRRAIAIRADPEDRGLRAADDASDGTSPRGTAIADEQSVGQSAAGSNVAESSSIGDSAPTSRAGAPPEPEVP
jgi:hypothetical protein